MSSQSLDRPHRARRSQAPVPSRRAPHRTSPPSRCPPHVAGLRPKLATLGRPDRAPGAPTSFKEQRTAARLPHRLFVTCSATPARPTADDRYTISREKHVEVDGKFADAVLGDFRRASTRFVVAVEGKGPRDPLDRPFAGRRCRPSIRATATPSTCPATGSSSRRSARRGCITKARTSTPTSASTPSNWPTTKPRCDGSCSCWAPTASCRPSGRCHLYDLLAESEKVGRELTKEFYVRYADMRQDAFEQLCRDNPDVPRTKFWRSTQKLLDRVLFCAFSEDRGLLPADTIRNAYEHRDPYHPRPIWENFRGLFRSINRGNAALGIHAYNGGLFADDPVSDALQRVRRSLRLLPRAGRLRLPAGPAEADAAKTRQRDRRRHPRPHLRAIDHRPGAAPQRAGRAGRAARRRRSTRRRRKKEGAFYTPSFITRYIVEQALGGVLDDRFEQLRRRAATGGQGRSQGGPGRSRASTSSTSSTKPQRAALGRVLGSLAGRADDDPPARPGLRQRRVPDRSLRPAARHLRALQRPAGRAARPPHAVRPRQADPGEQPLRRGPERGGHRDLPAEPVDQDGRARQGAHQPRPSRSAWATASSRDPAVTRRPSTGKPRSRKSSQQGGFDVVVGNPPYVRQEWLSADQAVPASGTTRPITAWPTCTSTSTSWACAC